MPAEIVPGEYCASWFASYEVPGSTPGTTYSVTLNGEGAPYCSCFAFKYAKGGSGWCKHLSYVHDHACLWNCQWHDGNKVTLRPVAVNDSRLLPDSCANCGGPLVAVMIAV